MSTAGDAMVYAIFSRHLPLRIERRGKRLLVSGYEDSSQEHEPPAFPPPPTPPVAEQLPQSAPLSSTIEGDALDGPPQGQPPAPPVPPLLPAVVTTQVMDADGPATAAVKITIESEDLFGSAVKRILKFSPSPTETPEQNISRLLTRIHTEYKLDKHQELCLCYFDMDVGEFVELEKNCWVDFMNQGKKSLRLVGTGFVRGGDQVDTAAAALADAIYQPVTEPARFSLGSDIVSSKTAPAGHSSSPSTKPVMEVINQQKLKMTAHLLRSLHQLPVDDHELLYRYLVLSRDLLGAPRTSSTPCSNVHWQTHQVVPTMGAEILAINGVRVIELCDRLQQALLAQRQRPLILQVLDVGRISTQSVQQISDISQATIAESPDEFPIDLFESKYLHASTKKLRKEVDKIVKDYMDCDWERAKKEGLGFPQATVISLYKYIESEMQRLELLTRHVKDTKIALTDEQTRQFREHVEEMIFKRLSEKTKRLWPIYEPRPVVSASDKDSEVEVSTIGLDYMLSRPLGDVVFIEIDAKHSLPSKLPFFRFLSLEDLGLSGPTAPELTTSRFAAASQLQESQSLLHREEWYLAVRYLHNAFREDYPAQILAHIILCVQLLTSALDAYLFDASQLVCSCGMCHVVDNHGNALPDTACVGVRCLHRSLDGSQKSDRSISADDLLPAIVWALIQANPPYLDRGLWLCSEFRHPNLLQGEEAFCLAQLSSAVEFVKKASYPSFEMPRDVYSRNLLRHSFTTRLHLACESGDLTTVEALIKSGADVNALCGDHRETALTIAIQQQHYHVLQYLTTRPDVVVDTPVNLFKGPYERGTALIVAAAHLSPQSAVFLLNAGANRYHRDDEGVCALDVAKRKLGMEYENAALIAVLSSNPDKENLTEAVLAGELQIAMGLVLQNVSLNECHAQFGAITPLIAAVLNEDFDLLGLLLARETAQADVNFAGASGETALCVCVKKALRRPSYELFVMCAVLLRCGADRHRGDHNGLSACSLLQSYRSKSVTLSVLAQVPSLAMEQHEKFGSAHVAPVNKTLLGVQGLLDIVLTDAYYEALAALVLTDPAKSPVYELAKDQSIHGVLACLLLNVDMNEMAPKKYNALIAAAYHQDVHMVRLILHAVKVARSTDYSELSNSVYTRVASFYAPLSPLRKRGLPPPQDVLLDQVDSTGMTALHYAAKLGNAQLAGLLLQHGADRNKRDARHRSALELVSATEHKDTADIIRTDPAVVSICLAAKAGDWDTIKALLAQGVSINTTKKHTQESRTGSTQFLHELYTPLIAAAAHGQKDLVRRILQECPEADVNQRNLLGHTPLIYAAMRGDETLVVRLLAAGAQRHAADETGKTVLQWAAQHESVLAILSNDPKERFIHDAIRCGDYPAALALLKQGVDVNSHRFERLPFTAGAATPHSSARKALERKSSKKSADKATLDPLSRVEAERGFILGETPLIVAARYQQLDILNKLLKAPMLEVDAVDDELRWTALAHAAVCGQEQAVLALLKAQANRKHVDLNKQSIPQLCLQYHQEQMAALVEADPRSVHIHDMCEQGKLLHVLALLKQGIAADARDQRFSLLAQTPLMAACSGGQIEVVRMLLRLPPVQQIIDAVDGLGRTALMRAAGVGALDVTGALLNAGADRSLRDTKGWTAYNHASNHSYSAAFRFLAQISVR